MKEANRVRKNEIKYNIQLTDEQKAVKEGVYQKKCNYNFR